MVKCKPVIYFFAALLMLASCSEDMLSLRVPLCIKTKTDLLLVKPVQDPPAEVWEWSVAGDRYYYITSDCCDQMNYLYDRNCREVCAPDGGFGGGGDGRCPDFGPGIVRRLIWKDPR